MGTFPYGLGEPVDAPTVAEAPPFEDREGVVQSGRLVDPATRQYVIDARGQTVGMPTVQQLVQLAVSTRRRSSVLTDFGEALTSIEDISDNFDRRIDTVMREAVAQLVRERFISVLEVTTERVGTSGAKIGMRWRDLSTGIEHYTAV